MEDMTRCRHQDVEGINPKDSPIGYYAHLKMLQSRLHVRLTTHQWKIIYRYNDRAV